MIWYDDDDDDDVNLFRYVSDNVWNCLTYILNNVTMCYWVTNGPTDWQPPGIARVAIRN